MNHLMKWHWLLLFVLLSLGFWSVVGRHGGHSAPESVRSGSARGEAGEGRGSATKVRVREAQVERPSAGDPLRDVRSPLARRYLRFLLPGGRFEGESYTESIVNNAFKQVWGVTARRSVPAWKIGSAKGVNLISSWRMDCFGGEIHVGRSPMRLLGVDLQRRYTVLCHGGTVSIVSPTDRMDYEAIQALGPVRNIVAPTCFHDTGMRTAAAAFPEARLWGVAGAGKHLRGSALSELGTDQIPEEWAGRFRCLGLRGMPKVNEHVIWHEASGSLITSDLIFNIEPPVDAWTRLFFKLNGAWQRPGPTRIFRSFIRDRSAFVASVRALLELPVEQILPAHGGPLTEPEEIVQTLDRLGR